MHRVPLLAPLEVQRQCIEILLLELVSFEFFSAAPRGSILLKFCCCVITLGSAVVYYNNSISSTLGCTRVGCNGDGWGGGVCVTPAAFVGGVVSE